MAQVGLLENCANQVDVGLPCLGQMCIHQIGSGKAGIIQPDSLQVRAARVKLNFGVGHAPLGNGVSPGPHGFHAMGATQDVPLGSL